MPALTGCESSKRKVHRSAVSCLRVRSLVSWSTRLCWRWSTELHVRTWRESATLIQLVSVTPANWFLMAL